MTLPFVQQSPTTLQISRHLFPLLVLSGFACVIAIGSYVLFAYPAQSRLDAASHAFTQELQTKVQKQTARQTQIVLEQLWSSLPVDTQFTRLSVDIAALAKTHNVHIPGMGYDIKPLRSPLAKKGLISFEAVGRYHDIRTFIFELESQWPYMFIETLSVERSKKSKRVAFTVHVATFLRDALGSSSQPSRRS